MSEKRDLDSFTAASFRAQAKQINEERVDMAERESIKRAQEQLNRVMSAIEAAAAEGEYSVCVPILAIKNRKFLESKGFRIKPDFLNGSKDQVSWSSW